MSPGALKVPQLVAKAIRRLLHNARDRGAVNFSGHNLLQRLVITSDVLFFGL